MYSIKFYLYNLTSLDQTSILGSLISGSKNSNCQKVTKIMSLDNPVEDLCYPTFTNFITGVIISKRKRRHHLVLSIKSLENETDIHKVPLDISNHAQLAICHLGATVSVEMSSRQVVAAHVTLVECAPDPSTVEWVFNRLKQQEQVEQPQEDGVSVAWSSLGLEEPSCCSNGNCNYAMSSKQIVRQLQSTKKPGRQRTRKPKFIELNMLDQLEHQANSNGKWNLFTVDEIQVHHDDDNVDIQVPSLPELFNYTTVKSNRGPLTRYEYMVCKKQPQIRHLIACIPSPQNYRHVLNVGCGRGDLTAALAARFEMVSNVDSNPVAVEAARQRLLGTDFQHQVKFVTTDFRNYANTQQNQPQPPVDLVVALHACGDLTDLALEYAIKVSAAFVICPCCFTKCCSQTDYKPKWHEILPYNDLQTIQRLAESKHQETSERAMTIINSMRLSCIKRQSRSSQHYQLKLTTFPKEYSLRNMVLVGKVHEIQV